MLLHPNNELKMRKTKQKIKRAYKYAHSYMTNTSMQDPVYLYTVCPIGPGGMRILLFGKTRKNVKREMLLQIMCFKSQMLEYFYLGRAVTALHSLQY
jgi:hypothetical protein